MSDGFDHDLHEVGAGLHADDVEDAAFGFGEEGFDFGFGVWMGAVSLRTITTDGREVTYLLHREVSG